MLARTFSVSVLAGTCSPWPLFVPPREALLTAGILALLPLASIALYLLLTPRKVALMAAKGTLEVGEPQTLKFQLRSKFGVPVPTPAGTVAQWTSSDEGVLELEPSADTLQCAEAALAPGSVTVSVVVTLPGGATLQGAIGQSITPPTANSVDFDSA